MVIRWGFTERGEKKGEVKGGGGVVFFERTFGYSKQEPIFKATLNERCQPIVISQRNVQTAPEESKGVLADSLACSILSWYRN